MIVNAKGTSFTLTAPSTLAVPSDAAIPILEPVHASWRVQAIAEDARREHVHQVFHLVMISQGSGSFLLAGQTIGFDGPALFLVSPGVRHTFSVLGTERVQYHELTFILRGTGAPRDWENLNGLLFGTTVTQPGPIPLPLLQDDNSRSLISELTLKVVEGLAGTKPTPGLAHYVLSLVALACECVQSAEKPTVGDPLIRAKDYIESHFTERFSLDHLAMLSGYSPKHLCRVFSARFGTAPFEYKRSLAMKSAEQLLAMTTYPIKQVAEAVGYPDLYHFSKSFRSWKGMPPGRFRTGKSGFQSL